MLCSGAPGVEAIFTLLRFTSAHTIFWRPGKRSTAPWAQKLRLERRSRRQSLRPALGIVKIFDTQVAGFPEASGGPCQDKAFRSAIFSGGATELHAFANWMLNGGFSAKAVDWLSLRALFERWHAGSDSGLLVGSECRVHRCCNSRSRLVAKSRHHLHY
ncbi:unnamed protein product [Effrenium voratum]|nr:unnamed protein product [Effrenium voratum]